MNKIFFLKTAALLLMLSIASASAKAQTAEDGKITTRAKMFGVGHTQILDTYLSPEKYSGIDLRFISHTTHERNDRKLSRQIVQQGNVSYVDNRASSGNEIAGTYHFGYALHYNWRFLGDRLNIKAGGMAEANLGFIYNTHNSNNPAQARAFLHISPSAAATYRFNIKNRPMAVRYEISVPLCGIMFSPNYGQSYYEIFSEGNYDHNAVPTTIASAPSMRHMLTFDFQLLRSTVRVGYQGEYLQSNVNNLKTHIYTHSLLIGVVKRFTIIKHAP